MKENRKELGGRTGKKRLSHVDAKGEARMVDVGSKPVVARVATAEAMLVCAAGTIRLLKRQALPKGDVLAVARVATAEAVLVCAAGTIRLLKRQALPKGDVLAVARVAGIQAAKQTAGLIPLCHVLPLDAVGVEFAIKPRGVKVICTVRTQARTGVEMEALTGATVAALTLYDMSKAVDKAMRIEGIRVVKKAKAEA
jgi:cyclic pyranopterin phosphate synthase